MGHPGEFYTISAPGRMHSAHKLGTLNPNFDGSTPKLVHAYLNKVWQLALAELHRLGISPYGFRVVEPHHDGTPHWHLLLFMLPEHAGIAGKVLRRYSLKTSPDEKGAENIGSSPSALTPQKARRWGHSQVHRENIDGAHLEQLQLPSELSGQNRDVFEFAFLTGLRTSELIALRWADICSTRQKLYVHRAKVRGVEKEPKTKSGIRSVDLCQSAMTVLECQRAYSDSKQHMFLDPTTGNPWKNDKPLRNRV